MPSTWDAGLVEAGLATHGKTVEQVGEAVVFSAKSYSLAGVAVAAAALSFGALPAYSATKDAIVLAQQQAEPADAGQASPEQPSAGDDAAPATAPDAGGTEEGQSRPAAEGPGDAASPESAAPTHDTETPSDAGASPAHDNAASPENGSADVAPVAPEAPATQADPSASEPSSTQSSAIEADQLKIGQAVFGSDGAKIGEVNGVKSDTAGKVQEILVTAGGAAGINAKVFAVSGDKIAEVKDGVKLSLTSEEAKQLPIIDNSNG